LAAIAYVDTYCCPANHTEAMVATNSKPQPQAETHKCHEGWHAAEASEHYTFSQVQPHGNINPKQNEHQSVHIQSISGQANEA